MAAEAGRVGSFLGEPGGAAGARGAPPADKSALVLEAYHSILDAALASTGNAELLRHTLELLFALPWLPLRQRMSVFLVDPPTGPLRLAARIDAAGEPAPPCHDVASETCVCGRARAEGKPIVEEVETPCSGTESATHVALPLASRGRTVGVLHALFPPGHAPAPIEAAFLERTASILGAEVLRRRREEAHDRLEAQFLQAQKTEAVGRLAGGVAHDFNNILTAVTSYAELGLAKLPPHNPLRRYFDEILVAADRAAELTRQLLAFSRRQVLAPQVLDLNTIITDMGRMLRRLLGEDVELVVRPAPRPVLVSADPAQLEQVLVNLAMNSRDAMPRGGSLVLETAHLALDESYARLRPDVLPGDYVLLAVSDTGSGMPEEVRRRIFEPFFTTRDQRTRSGLGLAAVYGIVRQSGGHIWVYSEPGIGTTFKLYFPAVQDSAASSPQGVTIAALPRGTETILLTEDDDSVRTVMAEVLTALGYRILEARGGSEALEIAASSDRPIDLLLTDLVMPLMSGKDLRERLSSLRPAIHVLYVSGYTHDAIALHNLLEPGAELLQKPFSPAALATRVRQMLDHPAPSGVER